MKTLSITQFSYLALLTIASPVALTASAACANEPVISDGTGAEGEPIVVDQPTEEPVATEDPGTDDGEEVTYDPEIAESGAGRPSDPAPNERGTGTKRGSVWERASSGNNGNHGEIQYRTILKGNKLIKIPLQ